jgi:DNA repair protein SbcC/Rad50
LQVFRQRLVELDRLQLEVLPLQQERVLLEGKIDRETAKIQAKLNELILRERQVKIKTDEHPKLVDRLKLLDTQITELENKKVYQKRIEDKGLGKKENLQRLDSDIRNYRRQLVELDRKLALLETPDASCPLCDRPLDENHWEHVLTGAKSERENIEQQISAAEEEHSRYGKEREALLAEYQQLQRELASAESLCEQRGKLQAQLDAISELQLNLKEIAIDKSQIEIAIESKSYASELAAQLQELIVRLAATNYSEQSHALARGDVDKLRWAEIKQEKIKDAERKQKQSIERKNQLAIEIAKIETDITKLQTESDLQIELQEIDRQIQSLGYDRNYHNQVATNLRESQSIQLQYQEVQQAEKTYPQLLDRIKLLNTNDRQNSIDRDSSRLEIDRIGIEIAKIPNNEDRIGSIEQQLIERRQQLDNSLSILGSLEQQLTPISNNKKFMTS